jgi:hypothetical protein
MIARARRSFDAQVALSALARTAAREGRGTHDSAGVGLPLASVVASMHALAGAIAWPDRLPGVDPMLEALATFRDHYGRAALARRLREARAAIRRPTVAL